ncbi:ATP-binding protein [Geobacter sp. AOG1]|uniref:ATP-binding protein n=1 Tax=Geobacter sp. AOG1 TaxID=1566346 RepID=UPI001CC5A0F4|nr:ATP-binding protein [Geobacter sp. AOG1]GFE56228.1 hypothetical protein AOG1_01060 [Geobacter sp. AOG1]
MAILGCLAPAPGGRRVTISRALMSITYPSRLMLVSAMNSCHGGYVGDPQHQCFCTPIMIQHYRSHISGPLLDRKTL